MPQTVLGIDLGSYSVKIAQVERGFGEFKLVRFYEVPLVAEEVLNYEQSASAALMKFFEENPIAYDSSVVSLPGTMASFRSLALPFGNAKKIDQTMEFELETLIPFDLEEILFDYMILAMGSQESKVLAAYVRESDFKRFLSQIQTSGLDPRYMGVDTIDLSYLSFPGFLPPEGIYAILDLGHTKSNLVILEGNKLKGLRCFSWGGHHITQAIAKALNCSYEQAEALKHGKGQVLAGSEDPVLQAIHACIESLQLQLKQTLFAFYESGERSIEALYLSGGTSRLVGMDSFFSSRLNINVGPLDVLDETFSEIHDRETARHVVPTAFAAALHAVYPNKGVKLNFRRGDYAYKRDIEQLGGSLRRIGVVAASVAVLAIAYFFIAHLTLASQVDRMNKNIAKIIKTAIPDLPKGGAAKQPLTLLDNQITSIQDKLKKVQGDNGFGALEVLKAVSAAMPPRDELVIDVDKITISPSLVRMDVRSASYDAIDKIKSSIEKSKMFKNVQPGSPTKGVRGEIRFSISFDIVNT